MKAKALKWLDEVKMAGMGIVLATKSWKFWLVFLLVLCVFGTLLSMLSAGMGAINLFLASDFTSKIQIIGDALLGFFGKDKYFLDFLQNFLIAFLQALLIALIVFVYKKRKKNSTDLQNAGIATGLALLGSGCPTCGTTLITPILTSIFSTSGYAIAGTVSGIITFVAILVLLWSLKRVGLEAYAIIIDEKWRNKRKNSTVNAKKAQQKQKDGGKYEDS